ncbi:MAG TPA: cell envelope integrity protein TolA [Candidatus Binatia bacterium]|nr:cell envelope integrity protein TolA [Candidatus Binatia bacterium]
MTAEARSPTIDLRKRAPWAKGAEDRLPKWLMVSLLAHGLLLAAFFVAPRLPGRTGMAHPVYVVDLIGGERIGAANYGTELHPRKQADKDISAEKAPVAIEDKKEVKKEATDKAKPAEKKAPPEEKMVLKEKTKSETVKKEAVKETKEENKSEALSADSVRERLLQSAVERAKARGESNPKSGRGETLSAGAGEGIGAAGLGPGGHGGPGVVKGMDYIIYQNRMLSTIKNNWVWLETRSRLKVVVRFNIRDNGEISGLKIIQPSGNPSFDESVVRAVRKSSPLPTPPEAVRKEFADVELTFRPEDLGS